MKPLHYYLVKLKLARVLPWVPAGLLLFTVGIKGCTYAGDNITPASVHVRGYQRSDGSYVHSYNRRPPGSRRHDAPYETLRFLSGLAVLAGATGVVLPLWSFLYSSPGTLLPPLPVTSSPPTRPTSARIPRQKAVARKQWLCEGCSNLIQKGDTYWYYESVGRYTERRRFCSSCRSSCISEAATLQLLMTEYERARAQWEAEERARWNRHFRSIYGCDP